MSHQPGAIIKSELSLFRPDLAAPRAEAADGGAGAIDAPLRSRAHIYQTRVVDNAHDGVTESNGGAASASVVFY